MSMGRDYDYEDTPQFAYQQMVEEHLILEEIERTIKNDPRN